MTGARSYTTKIWRQPSSIGFSSADALSTSMDPPGEPVISTQKRPCQKIQNGSEFPELVAQNFRNPQSETWETMEPDGLPWFLTSLATRIRKDSSHSASPLLHICVTMSLA